MSPFDHKWQMHRLDHHVNRPTRLLNPWVCDWTKLTTQMHSTMIAFDCRVVIAVCSDSNSSNNTGSSSNGGSSNNIQETTFQVASFAMWTSFLSFRSPMITQHIWCWWRRWSSFTIRFCAYNHCNMSFFFLIDLFPKSEAYPTFSNVLNKTVRSGGDLVFIYSTHKSNDSRVILLECVFNEPDETCNNIRWMSFTLP